MIMDTVILTDQWWPTCVKLQHTIRVSHDQNRSYYAINDILKKLAAHRLDITLTDYLNDQLQVPSPKNHLPICGIATCLTLLATM
jgi:hypothetical protein